MKIFLVQEVLQQHAGPHQAHAVAVHPLQEIPPRLIDKGDPRQVHREGPVRMARLGGVPAMFSLTDPRPGEPPFELDAEGASSLMDGHLEHWSHLLSHHRTPMRAVTSVTGVAQRFLQKRT